MRQCSTFEITSRQCTLQFTWMPPLTSKSHICQNHQPQTPVPCKSTSSGAAAQPWPMLVQRRWALCRRTLGSTFYHSNRSPIEKPYPLYLTHLNYLGPVSSYCAVAKNQLQFFRLVLSSKANVGRSLKLTTVMSLIWKKAGAPRENIRT